MSIEMIFSAKNMVGESLLWDDFRNRLLWVDIVGKTIHSLDPKTGKHTFWSTPDFVTSIGLRSDGGAVVGFTKSIHLWDFNDNFHKLASIEPGVLGNRLNEGVVAQDGSFWVGTMQNNISPNGDPIDITKETGRIYRCLPDGNVELLCRDTFGITNTFIWTEDNGFITADTTKNEIYHYDINSADSKLTGRRIIMSQFDRGLPDGSTGDVEGYIWNCRVCGGSSIIRFNQDGIIERVVELPCTWPTSCAFGGPELDTLYITSARFTMTSQHLHQHPEEGGIFAYKAGVTGKKTNKFNT